MTTEKQQSSPQKSKSGTPMPSKQQPPAKWKAVQTTLADVENTLGLIPDFVNFMPEQSIPGAWKAVKSVYFNPHTALEPKFKSLIGLGVAGQIPCEMLNYFESNACLAMGATEQERSEAVVLSAITRHWSTILNGSQLDRETFKKETDQIMAQARKMMEFAKGKMPPEENFQVDFTTAAEAYKDIEKTLGTVPKLFLLFPEEGIAGAWSEFKGMQLNPYTSLQGKHKVLISLAVAAQIPCEYCVYFHRAGAKLNGATDREMQEAVAIAATARHWSTIFHGSLTTPDSFRADADKMIAHLGNQMRM